MGRSGRIRDQPHLPEEFLDYPSLLLLLHCSRMSARGLPVRISRFASPLSAPWMCVPRVLEFENSLRRRIPRARPPPGGGLPLSLIGLDAVGSLDGGGFVPDRGRGRPLILTSSQFRSGWPYKSHSHAIMHSLAPHLIYRLTLSRGALGWGGAHRPNAICNVRQAAAPRAPRISGTNVHWKNMIQTGSSHGIQSSKEFPFISRWQ
jgi:hypothetical protein